MTNSFNRVLSKMPKATARKANLGKIKPRKVNLSLAMDLEEKTGYLETGYEEALSFSSDYADPVLEAIANLESLFDQMQSAVGQTEIINMLEYIEVVSFLNEEVSVKAKELGIDEEDITPWHWNNKLVEDSINAYQEAKTSYDRVIDAIKNIEYNEFW